jgi:hypothetical protein
MGSCAVAVALRQNAATTGSATLLTSDLKYKQLGREESEKQSRYRIQHPISRVTPALTYDGT